MRESERRRESARERGEKRREVEREETHGVARNTKRRLHLHLKERRIFRMERGRG